MNRLTVNDLTISYGNNVVVSGASFSLAEGDIGCLLGPSGCGKTTILLAIAGFQNPQQGEIILNGETIASATMSKPPEQRRVGMVFQDYALFPNMSVADNIIFGISNQTKQDIKKRLDQLLALIDMSEFADSYPHQLSGGQQQRVALARALAPKPDLLLLDEPFSNLDVELREQLAREVRAILKQEGIPAILVTHDQHEAFAMADDICVMNEGAIQQQDTAYNLYNHPTNTFVARFIGEGTIVAGIVNSSGAIATSFAELTPQQIELPQADTQIDVLIRPEFVSFGETGTPATIREIVFRGATSLFHLELDNGTKLLSQQLSSTNYQVNDVVSLLFASDHLVIIGRGQ